MALKSLFGLTFGSAFLEIIPLVVKFLARAYANLHLHEGTLEVEPQGDEGLPSSLDLAFQTTQFTPLEQEFTGMLRFVILFPAELVFGYVSVEKEEFILHEPSEGLRYLDVPGPDGFHLRSTQYDTSLILVSDEVLVTGLGVMHRCRPARVFPFLGHGLGSPSVVLPEGNKGAEPSAPQEVQSSSSSSKGW